MNENELKRLWQQQPLPAKDVKRSDELVQSAKTKMREFHRNIFWRDVREVAACVFVALAFLPDLFRSSSMLTKAGCVVLVISAIYIGCRLVFSKRQYDYLTAMGSLREGLLLEQRKVETQIHLLRTIHWWYMLPLYIGSVMTVFGRGSSLRFKVGFAVIYAVICVGIWWLNQYVVKKSLVPLKADLEETLQALPEQSAKVSENE